MKQKNWFISAPIMLQLCHAKFSVALFIGGILTTSSLYAGIAPSIFAPINQSFGPCIASLVAPASFSERCISWQQNVDSAVSFDSARRYLFAGSSDHALHVIDAFSSRHIARIPSVGRVVTEVLFSEDRSLMYYGTDKGMFYCRDAYSFAPVYSFNADSRIHNNIKVLQDKVIFSTSLGTVYNLNNRNGSLIWRIDQPKTGTYLRLASHSNIVVYDEVGKDPDKKRVAIGHSDGYVSIIRLGDGTIKKKINLASSGVGFFDIVAPMIVKGDKLYVASVDLGLFRVDLSSGQAILRTKRRGILQMASDSLAIYAAGADELLAVDFDGNIIWQQSLAQFKTKRARYSAPFDSFRHGARRVFYGTPSRILLNQEEIILGTSIGSMGIFSKKDGRLLKIAGNLLGFGPNISWVDDQVAAVTRRGYLVKF